MVKSYGVYEFSWISVGRYPHDRTLCCFAECGSEAEALELVEGGMLPRGRYTVLPIWDRTGELGDKPVAERDELREFRSNQRREFYKALEPFIKPEFFDLFYQGEDSDK